MRANLVLLCHFGGNTYRNTPNLAGSRLFMRSSLNKLDFFRSFWGNAKKYKHTRTNYSVLPTNVLKCQSRTKTKFLLTQQENKVNNKVNKRRTHRTDCQRKTSKIKSESDCVVKDKSIVWIKLLGLD